MPNEPYIEVIGSALICRRVEMHQGTIKIMVITRKTQIGLDQSVSLRDEVIDVLKSAGIGEDDIEDGGGILAHSSWSSRKQICHELRVRNADMQVFARAMAHVENVFSNRKTRFMSGVKHDFTFSIDRLKYENSEEANEQALKEAVANATRKASLLAERAGLTLGDVVSIAELTRPVNLRGSSSYGEYEDPADFDMHLAMSDSADSLICEDSAFYTPVAAPQSTGVVQFRVRFTAKCVGKDMGS